MEHQLRLKEDMGEVLHVVDFDQLKIENQQYLERIEERNNELLRLKTMTGKAVQVSVQTPRLVGILSALHGLCGGAIAVVCCDLLVSCTSDRQRLGLQGSLESI